MIKNMPFLKAFGETLVSDAHKITISLPAFFFVDPKLAEDFGNKVTSMFIFTMQVWQTEKSKPRKFKIELPAEMTFYYDSVERVGDAEKHMLYTLNKGTVFSDNVNVVQSATNLEKIFKIIATAKLTEVKYSDVVKVFFDSAAINATNPGATPVIFEAITSELARFKDDVTVPFRVALGDRRAKESDYQFVRIKELPKINSVFSGIGFEDITASVQSGVVKSEQNKPQNTSRLEDIAKY